MLQKIIAFVLFLISISLVFYWNVIRDADKKAMNQLEFNDEQLTGDVTQTGNLRVNGTSYLKVQGTINSQSWKGFDIKHPNKEGYRLRHVCLEGPEGGIYYRGRATKNVIPLPLYWKDLVDQASILSLIHI